MESLTKVGALALCKFGDGTHYPFCPITKVNPMSTVCCNCKLLAGENYIRNCEKTLLEVAAEYARMYATLHTAINNPSYDAIQSVLNMLRPTMLKMLPPGAKCAPLGAADVATVQSHYNKTDGTKLSCLGGRGTVN